MRKTYIIYAAFLVALLLAAIVAVAVLRQGDVSAALAQLGRGEREFQEAKRTVLLAAHNPMRQVVAFAGNRHKSRRARMQALEVLAELSRQQPTDTSGHYLLPLLADTSRDIRVGVLKAYGAFGTIDGYREVSRWFRESSDSAIVAVAGEALRSSGDALAEKLSSAIQTRDSAAVDSLAAIADSLPGRKGRICQDLASYYSQAGRFARAASYSSRLGPVRKWWMCGPFDNVRMAGFDRDAGPESRPFNVRDSFALGDTAKLGWMPVQVADAGGRLDLRLLYVKQVRAMAYLFTWVHSPQEREARVFIGSDDGPKVWLNGQVVWAKQEYRGYQPDQDVARMHLRKGANALLIKLTQEMGGWEIQCRITDPNGDAMRDVYASLSPEGSEGLVGRMLAGPQRTAAQWLAAVDSLHAEDEAMADVLRSAVADSAAPASRRMAAIGLLGAVNRRRLTPVGEDELLRLLQGMVRTGTAGPLLTAAATALADMRSGKALEAGKALQGRSDAALAALGSRLVSAYCRSRLARLGNMADSTRRAEIAPVVAEVESYQPADAWVLNRLAAFHGASGDTALARRMRERIAMPAWWLCRPMTPEQNNSADPLRAYPEFVPPVSAFAPGTTQPPAGWKPVGGPGVRTATYYVEGSWGNDYFVLYTVVTAPRSGGVRMNVSIPGPYRLWLNGGKVGSAGLEDAAHYSPPATYVWLAEDYDVRSFDVSLRRGANTVALVFGGKWYHSPGNRYFRLAFATPAGKPVGCEGNEIRM